MNTSQEKVTTETGDLWRKTDRLGRVVAIDLVTSVSGGWIFVDRYTFSDKIQTKYPQSFLSEDGCEYVPDGVSLLSEISKLCYPATVITSAEANWPQKICDYFDDGHRVFATNSESIQSLMFSAAERLGIDIFVEVVK